MRKKGGHQASYKSGNKAGKGRFAGENRQQKIMNQHKGVFSGSFSQCGRTKTSLWKKNDSPLGGGLSVKNSLCYAQKYRFILALFLLQKGLWVVLGKEPERYVLSKLRQPGGGGRCLLLRVRDETCTGAVRQGENSRGLLCACLSPGAAGSGGRRQSARKFWRRVIPVPFLLLTIVGFVSSDVGLPLGMVVGGFFSLLIGAFYLYDGYSTQHDRPWEGVVVNKYARERVRQCNDKYDNHIETQTYFEYHLEFRTAAGEKKEIMERDSTRRYYDYFRVGDYVRYHPQLNNFYEKYDKSRDKYLICPVCGKESKASLDRCKYCHNILVK